LPQLTANMQSTVTETVIYTQ